MTPVSMFLFSRDLKIGRIIGLDPSAIRTPLLNMLNTTNLGV